MPTAVDRSAPVPGRGNGAGRTRRRTTTWGRGRECPRRLWEAQPLRSTTVVAGGWSALGPGVVMMPGALVGRSTEGDELVDRGCTASEGPAVLARTASVGRVDHGTLGRSARLRKDFRVRAPVRRRAPPCPRHCPQRRRRRTCRWRRQFRARGRWKRAFGLRSRRTAVLLAENFVRFFSWSRTPSITATPRG